jgi:hypothetical protein
MPYVLDRSDDVAETEIEVALGEVVREVHSVAGSVQAIV